MKNYKEEKFAILAKNTAKMFDDQNDPLIFEGIEINSDGEMEAFFHDSKTTYYIGEDLEFCYACAR